MGLFFSDAKPWVSRTFLNPARAIKLHRPSLSKKREGGVIDFALPPKKMSRLYI
jgi:hypothetical protein